MTKLNLNSLAQVNKAVKLPPYNLATTGCGIVHIGPGAFHRGHQAVYTELAMAYGGNWRIKAVSMRSRSLKEKLASQDNLYSLVILDEEPYTRIVGAIDDVLVLDEDREEVMACLCSPETFIVSLTITEKGYCLNSNGTLDFSNPDIVADLKNPSIPVSAIGLLAEALRLRQQSGLPPITIISCDNLSDNGSKLRDAVISFVACSNASLAEWIGQNICFPNTMVDSITPASDEALLQLAEAQTGLSDAWPIQREAFAQWVIEDKFSGPRPAWDKVGVTFTSDVSLFEKAKLRILNGTHSTLAYVGSLAGLDTVYSAISQPAIEGFISSLLKEEILPSIQAVGQIDLDAYAQAIIQRYHNPHIRHLLAQIAWDGSQKLPVRILNTIRDNLTAGRSIQKLCVPIAAWILFIARQIKQGATLTDPMSETLTGLAVKHQGETEELANRILDLEQVFAELSENGAFRESVIQQLRRLSEITGDNLNDCLVAL
ncbi:mannitol dehydrogenase family protein [Alteromonas aestuariivivens]|uniref:Mannitol dehydrogenase family protein n=1 Tax=Alteromonas aestuariivivens TaxID=1938339 RepID=A0A3D8M6Q5_9ALTE|nr:mannitol dehydrogenase family protein [Alteromonas aestuariivivens]RDV25472.1 mannitol dehydrogenase family protein [Alteromonas aestuariivivens]